MSEELEKWAWDEACRIFHDTANNHHVWGSIATAPEDWQYNLKLEYANAIVDAHKSSQARLSEAVKVLEEAIPLLDEAADKLEAEGMWGTSERDMAIRARQFLANLGEENVR